VDTTFPDSGTKTQDPRPPGHCLQRFASLQGSRFHLDSSGSVGDCTACLGMCHRCLGGEWIARTRPRSDLTALRVCSRVLDLCQVAITDCELHEAAIEGVAKISPLIFRYTQCEALYMQEESDFKDHFENSLIGLYASILDYQISLAPYFRRWSLTRILRATINRDNWSALLDTIEKRRKDFMELAHIYDARQAQSAQSTILSLLTEDKERTTSLTTILEGIIRSAEWKEMCRILRWVSDTSIGSIHQSYLIENKLAISYAEAGQWLFRDYLFRRWLGEHTWNVSSTGSFQSAASSAWAIRCGAFLQQHKFFSCSTNSLVVRDYGHWEDGSHVSGSRMASRKGLQRG
jgi:predicted nucleic acid-binding protein